MSYSKDLRERAVAYNLEGHTINETSNIFGIGTSTLNRWLKQYRETGDLSNKPLDRKPRKIDDDKLKNYVRENKNIIQEDIAREFNCTAAGVCKALKRNGITLKKRHFSTKNKTLKK